MGEKKEPLSTALSGAILMIIFVFAGSYVWHRMSYNIKTVLEKISPYIEADYSDSNQIYIDTKGNPVTGKALVKGNLANRLSLNPGEFGLYTFKQGILDGPFVEYFNGNCKKESEQLKKREGVFVNNVLDSKVSEYYPAKPVMDVKIKGYFKYVSAKFTYIYKLRAEKYYKSGILNYAVFYQESPRLLYLPVYGVAFTDGKTVEGWCGKNVDNSTPMTAEQIQLFEAGEYPCTVITPEFNPEAVNATNRYYLIKGLVENINTANGQVIINNGTHKITVLFRTKERINNNIAKLLYLQENTIKAYILIFYHLYAGNYLFDHAELIDYPRPEDLY